MAADDSLLSVFAALAANVMIAIAKGVAAALTGSAALFSETLHTVADTGNELLLWIAVSLMGITAPVWALAVLVWLKWQRHRERADAQLVLASLGLENKE